QRKRRRKRHVKAWPPRAERRVDGAEAAAGFILGRDRGVVDQSVELAAAQPVADFLDAAANIVGVGEVDLHMVLVAARPRAERAERLPRHGDHPPATGTKL